MLFPFLEVNCGSTIYQHLKFIQFENGKNILWNSTKELRSDCVDVDLILLFDQMFKSKLLIGLTMKKDSILCFYY